MTEKCKHRIKDKNSTWNNEIFRDCRVTAGESGYCGIHDPESIAKKEAYASAHEIIEKMRETNRLEEAAVGIFIRLNKPEEFAEIIENMRKAKEVNDVIRNARYGV